MSDALPAAVVAALAVWLVLAPPAQQLRRLAPSERFALPSFLTGRPGAPPLRQRSAVGVAAGLVLSLVIGGPLGVLAGAVAGAGTTVAMGYLAPKTDVDDLVRELPDALEFLAVCLEAGLPMSRAVETVADVSPEATAQVLRQVEAHLLLGRAGALAWDELRDHPAWGPAAADIARAERSGTSLIGVLRVHAQDARTQRHELASKKARTVGVKSVVPLMACFLPAFILVGVVPILLSLIRSFFG